MHHEPIPFPAGDGGKEPHRAVGFRRNAERLVVDDFCGGDGSRDVTALEFDPPWIAYDHCAGILDAQYGIGHVVVDRHEPRCRDRLLARLGDHDRHVLAVMQDLVVLEWEPR